MHLHLMIASFGVMGLLFLSPAVAEQTTNPSDEGQSAVQSFDCKDPVSGAQRAVKDTVGPLYANGADQVQLESAANQLDRFITDATYCRIALQSSAQRADPAIIGEWLSLHQWLNRLADTFARSASDSTYTKWKDEYTLFAEVYEFEP